MSGGESGNASFLSEAEAKAQAIAKAIGKAKAKAVAKEETAPKGWLENYIKRPTQKTKQKPKQKPKLKQKRKKREWCFLSKEEYEANITWLLHKDWWLLDELDRQSQQKEVRIILENIKQRQREASAKALAQKTVWICPLRTLPQSATAFNMALVLRRETNKAAALEKRRLSVEREKLATKKAEEEPKSMEIKKQSSSVGAKTVVNKVDSISPKKKNPTQKKNVNHAWKKAKNRINCLYDIYDEPLPTGGCSL